MAKEVLQLSRFEQKKIEKRRDQEFDKRIFRRLAALRALDEGHFQEEVPACLQRLLAMCGGESRPSKSGLDALCTIGHQGRSAFLIQEQLEALVEQIEAGSFHSAKQAFRLSNRVAYLLKR